MSANQWYGKDELWTLTSSPCIERRFIRPEIVFAQFRMCFNQTSPELKRRRIWEFSQYRGNMILKATKDSMDCRKHRFLSLWHVCCSWTEGFKPPCYLGYCNPIIRVKLECSEITMASNKVVYLFCKVQCSALREEKAILVLVPRNILNQSYIQQHTHHLVGWWPPSPDV